MPSDAPSFLQQVVSAFQLVLQRFREPDQWNLEVITGIILAILSAISVLVGVIWRYWRSRRTSRILQQEPTTKLAAYELRELWQKQSALRTDDLESRNRRAMIEKVRAIWITGVLNRSLYKETLITLGLAERPDAVERPMDILVQRPGKVDQPLPQGTRIVDVYDELSGTLLILGAPASGKTTLLLELARDLLDRAEQDDSHPIPVVFPLSTWVEQQLPLKDWFVDELSKRYDVPRKIGQAWAEADQILPLLDGLDEVKVEHRATCVTAINTFRQGHGLLPLVVCSRTADYEALQKQLRLQGAVIVQPLTRGQVDLYLRRGGEHLAAARQALFDDPTLWELLDTPLMLQIFTLVYVEQPIQELEKTGRLEERRHHLFAAYIAQMFKRRSAATRYTATQTKRWLSWLAKQMIQHSQTVFYIEWIQADWLPKQAQQRFIHSGTKIVAVLGIGLIAWLIAALFFGRVYGLLAGLLAGLLHGLFVGLCMGLLLWLISKITHQLNEPAEVLRWSWSKMLSILTLGLYFGLALGSVIGLGAGVTMGIASGLFGWIIFGFTSESITTRTTPNEGIRRALRNSLCGGLVIGLVTAVLFELDNIIGGGWYDMHTGGLRGGIGSGLGSKSLSSLLYALAFGWFGSLFTGGYTCLRHLILRLILVWDGLAPWRYPSFLNYAAERILLRKVGGGYMFIHRYLLEYFASLDIEAKAKLNTKG